MHRTPRLELVKGHPRLWISPSQLPEFRRQAGGYRKRWRDDLLKKLEPSIASPAAVRAKVMAYPDYFALALGQAWRITGEKRYSRAARWLYEGFGEYGVYNAAGYDTWGITAETGALLYDWFHDYWTSTGEAEHVAQLVAFASRRALDDLLRLYIVDDWHNYSLGLQAGVTAGALALGTDHPRVENGALLKTLHQLHFTGYSYDGWRLQDAYRVPPTRMCLDAALRSGGGIGFATHAEASGAYHSVDAWDLVKMAEYWTSALTPKARGGDIVWPEFARAGEAMLAFLRPDMQNMVWGDATPYSGPRHTRIANTLYHLQARTPNPTFAEFLNATGHSADGPYPLHALLCAQPGAAAEPAPREFDRSVFEAWPTAAFLDPVSVLRSGWDADATFITFRCGRHGGWHNHLDHNSFTIYRGGPLALDSGGIEYTSTHRPEYAMRTLAHNAILVRNPREKHWNGRLAKPTQNDGGQRLVTLSHMPPNPDTGGPHAILTEERRAKLGDEFEMGRMLAFEPGEQFDYLAGDATRAYTYPWSGLGTNPSRRVEEAVRQLVFLKPDLVVVFDRIEATRPEFEKTWLLHTQGDPVAFAGAKRLKPKPGVRALPSNACVEAECERGRLTAWPLWPKARTVRAIGGKGYECFVEHAVEPGAKRGFNYPAPANQEETGRWRIEVQPKKAARRDCFLTVLHAGLKRHTPARKQYTFEVRETEALLEVHIYQAKRAQPLAVLGFRTQGAVRLEYRLAQGDGVFEAPPPERVPKAKG